MTKRDDARRGSAVSPFGGDAFHRNILYFKTSLDAEPGEGAVGWAVVQPIRDHLQAAGATVGPLQRHWDGVRFSCRFDRPLFQVVLSPYFEATPLEWSVQVLPLSVWKYLLMLFPGALERVCRSIDDFFGTDQRYSRIRWQCLRSD